MSYHVTTAELVVYNAMMIVLSDHLTVDHHHLFWHARELFSIARLISTVSWAPLPHPEIRLSVAYQQDFNVGELLEVHYIPYTSITASP